MPPFTHHDDQAEWGDLVLALIDDGVEMNDACHQARAELETLLAYAAEWDSNAAELVIRSN
jgi:hypothetical protein